MPFHEYISTKFGATIVLWQLTENEQTIATLLSEKERIFPPSDSANGLHPDCR